MPAETSSALRRSEQRGRLIGGNALDGIFSILLTVAPAQPVDTAAVAFGGASGATIALREQRLERVALGWRRAVVDEALHTERGADPFGDDLGDVDDAIAAREASLDVVADAHHRCWLGRLPVDVDMATPACIGSLGPCLRQPHRM